MILMYPRNVAEIISKKIYTIIMVWYIYSCWSYLSRGNNIYPRHIRKQQLLTLQYPLIFFHLLFLNLYWIQGIYCHTIWNEGNLRDTLMRKPQKTQIVRMNKLKISDYFSSVPRFKHKCLEFGVIVFSTHTLEYMDIYWNCIQISSSRINRTTGPTL